MKTIYKDKNGFEYKNSRSKNSKVKEYRIAPIAKKDFFDLEERIVEKNTVVYRSKSERFSYNYRGGVLTINQVIHPSLSKKSYIETVHYDAIEMQLASFSDFMEACRIFESE
jgi:hypothetical protein